MNAGYAPERLVPPAIGLGCAAFSGGYGPVREGAIIRTVQHALDMGATLLDLADHYGGGMVERTVGRAITGRRADALLSTRGGLRMRPDGRPDGVDGSPEYLIRACHASLRRLQVDHIDLYYLARVDPRVPVEDSVGRLAELVHAGRIRHIGLSRVTPDQLRRACAVHPVSAVAVDYSLLDQRAEAELLPTAAELGVTVVACRPLGRGLLTGRISTADQLDAADVRRTDPCFRADQVALVRRVLPAMEQMAATKNVSLARLALAWLLTRPGVVPVPSTRTPLHLEMNAAAARIPLSQGECEYLAALFKQVGPG